MCDLHGCRIVRSLPDGCPLREDNPLLALLRLRRSIDAVTLGCGVLAQQAEIDEHVYQLCAYCTDEGGWTHPVVRHLRADLGFDDPVFDLEADGDGDEPDADPMPQQADVAEPVAAVIVPAAVRRRLGRAVHVG